MGEGPAGRGARCLAGGRAMRKLIWAALLALVLVPALAGGLAAEEPVVVFDGSYKVVSLGDDNVQWTWKATVSNHEEVARTLRVRVHLLDANGFEIAHRIEKVHVGPNDTGTVTGHGRLKRELWDKVEGANYTLEE